MCSIPENKILGLRFYVTEKMVDMFADITGDKSSLHTVEKFARRSMYRKTVVHGMLPVSYLTVFMTNLAEEKNVRFKRLSAQFVKPVLIDCQLNLCVKVTDIDQENRDINCDFMITHQETKTIVMQGCFVLEISDEWIPNNENIKISSKIEVPGLIQQVPSENRWTFEEIKKGQMDGFRFLINNQTIRMYFQMLELGLAEKIKVGFDQWFKSGCVTDLLANSLYSTFVGMYIPGRDATFLDFNSSFFRMFELDREYILEGKVSFKSESMQTIVEMIEIRESNNGKPLVSGKINVKINEPHTLMPTLESLQKKVGEINLKDKVVLITGGSRGIGETTAKLFSVYGAKVAVNYFKGKDDAQRIVQEIEDHGGQAMAVGADISNKNQVEKMIKAICEQFLTIHILVNNAVRDAVPIPFMELTWDDIQNDIDVTLKGAFHCSQAVIPLMKQNKGGKIINVSTVFTEIPVVDQAKYILSKSGLIGLARSLAVEFAKDNIQVNTVVSSIVETDLSKHVPQIIMEQMKQRTPMRRNASPTDVAQSIVFLASAMAPFTTGQKLMVTGGNAPFL